MIFALIRYNLSYYIRKLRYIGWTLTYVVFLFINYQSAPIAIWSNYHITALAVFIFSVFIGASFINCEDEQQQQITRIKVKNEVFYYVSKIISSLIFIFPFYAILVVYPIGFDLFTRKILLREIFISLMLHFLYSHLGVSISVFFDTHIAIEKNKSIPLQALITLVSIMPLAGIFPNNILIKYIVFILPPVNFLSERLFSLQSNVFLFDGKVSLFVIYSMLYSIILLTTYIWIVKKKNKLR